MKTTEYSLIWQCTRLTAIIPEGNASGSISVEAMPFPMAAGEYIIIRDKFNRVFTH